MRRNRPLLKGWITLGLNIRLKVTFTANIYTPLDKYMVLLLLCCWKFSHKNAVADFIRLNLNFIHKNNKFGF